MISKGICLAVGAALVLTGCTTASTSSPESAEETEVADESDELLAPEPEPSDEPSPSPSRQEPTGYADVVNGPLTSAAICDSYSAVLDRYGEIIAKRKKTLKGKDGDPYTAAKFANRNAWLYEDVAVGFEREMTSAVTDALNTVSDGQAGLVESLDPFREDSFQACGLDQEYSTVRSDVAAVDQQQASVVRAANNKPWYPKGYNEYSSNVAWKWADGPDPCGYSRCWYNYIKVISLDGCPSGLYAEVNELNSAGTVIGWSNDSVPSLRPGQKARLVFVSYDPADASSLAEISCY